MGSARIQSWLARLMAGSEAVDREYREVNLAGSERVGYLGGRILAGYIAVELASLAVFKGVREAHRGRIFSIVSLEASVATLVSCPGRLLYPAGVRR